MSLDWPFVIKTGERPSRVNCGGHVRVCGGAEGLSSLLTHLLTAQTTEPMVTAILKKTWLLNGLASVSQTEDRKALCVEALGGSNHAECP